MLCSEEKEERKFAVDKIIEIRGEGDKENQVGNSSVRIRKTPDINEHAKKLEDLIDWSQDVSEPPLTCFLTIKVIKYLINTPMRVPCWSTHTQSVERLVKEVTEASVHVYSQEKRDECIRSQEVSAELMPKNRSKKDLMALTKFKTDK